jgi:hypothetical protein
VQGNTLHYQHRAILRGYSKVKANTMKTIKVTIYGREYIAKVLKVHPGGTVDVELPSGRCFRVSGLSVK